MVDLTGHETGNGGYSQRTPTALPGLLYSENDSRNAVFWSPTGPQVQNRFIHVEANRINAEANLFRYYAALHLPDSFLEATPWSIVHSLGHFGRPEAPYPPQLFLEAHVTGLAPDCTLSL